METCPNCGEFSKRLNEVTGWCEGCTRKETRNTKSKLEAYLEKNADELEYYLLQGLSLNQAIDRLHSNNGRPRCVSCGKTIRRAPRTAVFCRTNPQCRRFSRRYVYLYNEKGMTKAQALATVMEELT